MVSEKRTLVLRVLHDTHATEARLAEAADFGLELEELAMAVFIDLPIISDRLYSQLCWVCMQGLVVDALVYYKSYGYKQTILEFRDDRKLEEEQKRRQKEKGCERETRGDILAKQELPLKKLDYNWGSQLTEFNKVCYPDIRGTDEAAIRRRHKFLALGGV